LWSESSLLRPGSALRLFQPLSGFLAGSSFVALFRATTVSGLLPSEFSPRERSLTPLEAAWLPCSYPPACGNVRLSVLSPPVSSDAHAFAQLPGFPRRLWVSFPRAEACFPVALDFVPQNRFVLPASPTSKLHSLPRVRSQLVRVSPRQQADTLLGFSPLELSPSTPRSLDPSRPEGLNTKSCLSARDSRDQ
jgi:hypothetical protein